MKKRRIHTLVGIVITAAFGQWLASGTRAANPVASLPAATLATSAAGSLTLSVSDPTEAVSPVTISGYTFSFSVVPETGSTGTVTLSGASVPSGALLPGTFFGSNAHGSQYVVTDAELGATAIVPIVPGSLFNLKFVVGSGASGVFDIDINQSGVNASVLYDANGDDVPGTMFADGTIDVIVPEPASSVICSFALAALCVRRRCRAKPFA